MSKKHFRPEGHKYCQKCGKEYGVEYFEGSSCGEPSPSKDERVREEIRSSLTFYLPAGIKDFEWEMIIKSVESLIRRREEEIVAWAEKQRKIGYNTAIAELQIHLLNNPEK